MAEPALRFCVLGGGIPGLSTAFFLQKRFPHARIAVLERSARLGGPIRSRPREGGHAIESGYHSSILVNKNGREALGLARLLGLEDDVVSANIEASARRHLFHCGRVQQFPRLQHSLYYGPAILAEPLWPRGRQEDESVHAFVTRRSSRAVADRLADPLCRGMLAGDARQLSVRTCFPRLWFNERHFRSVFVGSALSTVAAHRRRSWLSLDLLDPLLQRVSAGGRVYSLRGGLGALIARLENRLEQPVAGTRPAEIVKGAEVARIQALSSSPSPSAEVTLADGRSFQAETVVAAVPPSELAGLLEASGLDQPCGSGAGASTADSLCGLMRKVPHETVAVVNVAFASDVLRGRRFRGPGYFVGSLEGQEILAMSWDSLLYPEPKGAPAGGSRLTVYLGARADGGARSAEEAEAAALEAVRRHLGIEEEPSEVQTTLWPEVAPQYRVGHHEILRQLNAARVSSLPWLQVAGPGYFGTRNAADEVVDARELADALGRRFANFPGLVENEVASDVARRYGGGFDVE